MLAQKATDKYMNGAASSQILAVAQVTREEIIFFVIHFYFIIMLS